MDPLTVASFGQRHLAKAQDINVLRKQMKNFNLSYIKTTRILKFFVFICIRVIYLWTLLRFIWIKEM